MTKAQLQDILDLPIPERLQIAEAIWDSLESDSFSITDAHRKIIDQRLEAYQAAPDDLLTWSEVQSRLSLK